MNKTSKWKVLFVVIAIFIALTGILGGVLGIYLYDPLEFKHPQYDFYKKFTGFTENYQMWVRISSIGNMFIDVFLIYVIFSVITNKAKSIKLFFIYLVTNNSWKAIGVMVALYLLPWHTIKSKSYSSLIFPSIYIAIDILLLLIILKSNMRQSLIIKTTPNKTFKKD